MINQIWFRPFCNKRAKIKCDCLISHAFCSLHAKDHIHYLDSEHPIEEISNNWIEAAELQEHPFKAFEATLLQISEQLPALQKIKIKLLTVDYHSSYCAGLLKNGLLKIEEYKKVLDQHKTDAECVASIEDLEYLLRKIIMIIKNVKMEVEFFEKLYEALLLEKEVKSHWLAKFNQSPEMLNELKSEYNRKIKETKDWCFEDKNKGIQNVISLGNKLDRISELIERDFEAKHLFLIHRDHLTIYGAETLKRQEHTLRMPFLYSACAIEIPNSKIFCLDEYKNQCIIDLKDMKISKILPNSSGGNQFALLFFESCVYTFGSTFANASLNYLDRYDIISYKITNLAKPPISASRNFQCVAYRNSILFCAKDSLDFYKFDLRIESYSKLPISGLHSFSLKMLFTAEKRAYLIDTISGIFESEDENDFIWRKIGKCQKYYYAEDCNISTKELFYFSIMEKDLINIYKFDLGSKKLYEIAMNILMVDSDQLGSTKHLCKLNELGAQTACISVRLDSPQTEQDFREVCSLYQNENHTSDPFINQTYQELVGKYHQISSLYLFGELDGKANLFTYNTENEREEAKLIETPNRLDSNYASIIQLPNGELFCICKEYQSSFITFIINKNYELRMLPSQKSYESLTAIYYRGNVYCFGEDEDYETLSYRFDLDRNLWFKLTPIPCHDLCCNSALFNKNILISNYRMKNLMQYLIDIDSFATISYDFQDFCRKVLINGEERLYLIEWAINGFIYESGVEDEYNWKQIAKSTINQDCSQVYWIYNKRGIYISTLNNKCVREYYKFDLDQNAFIGIAYYDKHIAIRKLGGKVEEIKCYNQTFNLSPQAALSFGKFTINYLGRKLEKIECCNEAIKLNPADANAYNDKGNALKKLERYLEAIECFDEAIKIDPMKFYAYHNKGCPLMLWEDIAKQ